MITKLLTSYGKTNMHLKTTILTLLSLAILTFASEPMKTPTATWNDQLKLYDIGTIDDEPGQINTPALYAGACPDVIQDGGYACGSFHSEGINALRSIYRCVNGVLVSTETCAEDKDNLENGKNRCVRNQRRPKHKFFLFQTPSKVVCQRRALVEAP